MKNEKRVRLLKLYEDVAFVLGEDGISSPDIFSTGYEGVTFSIDSTKIYVIEQDGVVGLEDHQAGYLELRVDGETVFKNSHRSKRFGDVTCLDEELDEWYKYITEIIIQKF